MVVERLDISARQIEHDRTVAAGAHLGNEFAHLRRLAGTGRADQAPE